MSVRVREVLAALFVHCRGLLELRALPSTDRAFVAPTDIAAVETFAIAHRHEHVFFAVATRRDASSGALENCEHVGAVYVDLDCHGDAHTFAEAFARLAAFPLPPSIIILSGGGLHVYWLLRESADVQTEAPALRMVLRQLAHTLDGDLASAECARVLRLPGTLNHKYDPPARVTIQTFEPDRRVNLSDFEFLPSEPAVSRATVPADVLNVSAIAAGRRNRTLYRLGRALRAKQLPAAAIAEALRAANATCQPAPLDTHELDAIIQQVLTQPDRADFAPSGEPAAADDLTLTSLTTLLSEPDDAIDWLIDGLIASASLNLLAGKPKAGKSTLARQLAFCLATGTPFIGRSCLGGPVWYLVLEDKRSEVRRHFRALGSTGDEPVRFLFGNTKDLLRKLGRLADRERPRCIIVDTLQRLIFAKDLNDYAEVTTRLDPVLAIARSTSAAMLLVHHAAKADRAGIDQVLGSTALTGSVDNVFLLNRTDRYRVLSSVQRIGSDLEETVITLDEAGRARGGQSRHAADVDYLQTALRQALTASAGLTRAEWLDAVEGRKQVKLEALRRIIESGTTIRTGTGKRGDAFRYHVGVSGSQVPQDSWEPESTTSPLLDFPKTSAPNGGSQVPTLLEGGSRKKDGTNERF